MSKYVKKNRKYGVRFFRRGGAALLGRPPPRQNS